MLCPLIYCIVLCIHCCSIVLYALASTDTRGASTSGSVVLNVLYVLQLVGVVQDSNARLSTGVE